MLSVCVGHTCPIAGKHASKPQKSAVCSHEDGDGHEIFSWRSSRNRGTPRVCSEPHPRARLCSDGGFSCYFQNYHPLEKLWNLPHRCRSSSKWSTVVMLVAMLPPKQCFPSQDNPSASPEPLWTRVCSEHPQTLHPPAHLPLKSLLSGCDIGATPAPH